MLTKREVQPWEDEPTDPALTEALQRDMEDSTYSYAAVIWGTVLAVIVGWSGALSWIGWHLRALLRAAGVLLLVLALMAVPATADTARPVSVAASFGWAAAPVALDYAGSAYCFSRNPNCYEANIALAQHHWLAAMVVAGTTIADQWLSRVNRTLMWVERVVRSLWHGFLFVRAMSLAAR